MRFGHRRVLDLPPAGHLLDDEFGVHPHRDVVGAQAPRLFQPGDQSAIFGDVVGGDPDVLSVLGERGAVVV